MHASQGLHINQGKERSNTTDGQTITHQIPEDKHLWDIVQLSVISCQIPIPKDNSSA